MMIMIADAANNQYADAASRRPYERRYTLFHKLLLFFLVIIFYYQQTAIYPNLQMSG